MFKRIVSQLSLSPSAVSELTFYARRLQGESVTRTFSAIAAVLIVALQFAVITVPPTPSNAASPGDLVYGGITSKADLLNRYDASAELKALYSAFGISRTDLTKVTAATINSKDHALQSVSRVAHESNQSSITVGSHTYYYRPLFHADTGSFVQTGSKYQVLEGTRSSDGGYFSVMLLCGNIVFKKLPPKPTPTPPKPTPIPTPIPTPKPTPSPTKTPKPTPTPLAMTCVNLTGDVSHGEVPLKVTFTGVGTATGQTLTEYQFDFGDHATLNQPGAKATHTYTTPGKYTATLKVKGSSGTISPAVAACSYTIEVTTPPAAFTKAKAALNLTQNIDATTKPANAGDTIKYTLTTKNTGGTAELYTVVEHIEDVLEYATVTDPAGATLSDGVLTWPDTTIKPGATLTRTFTVAIKNPIPSTPAGLSDPNSFDLRLDNLYGNVVQIKLTPPLAKQVEGAATELPQTGAGTSTVIVLLVSAFTLFFYFRNRQLAAEIKLLRGNYQQGPTYL